MIAGPYAQAIENISKALDLELKPDSFNSCKLNIRDKLEITLEADPARPDQMLLGSILGELSPGPYRENILLQAMQANSKAYPRAGNFSYSLALNSLVLYEMIPLDHFSTDEIVSHLLPFIQVAYQWKEAIEQGAPPPDSQTQISSLNLDIIFGNS